MCRPRCFKAQWSRSARGDAGKACVEGASPLLTSLLPAVRGGPTDPGWGLSHGYLLFDAHTR